MRKPLFALCAALYLAGQPALADRLPTPEERARIEGVLRSKGFTGWEKIESEDGVWQVDDAIASDGRKYDLKLNATFEIVLQQLED